MELAAQSTLVGDLNAMRSQLNKIIGVGNWYDELAGTQDLADIQGAMQVTGSNAAFQGDVSAVGNMSAVDGTFSGDLAAVSGSFSGDVTAEGDLRAISDGSGGHIFSVVPAGELGPGYPAALNMEGSIFVNNDVVSANGYLQAEQNLISVQGGLWIGGSQVIDNSRNVYAADVSGVDGTFSGDLSAVSGSFSAVSISGDVAQRLYIVGADGEIKDSDQLVFDGSYLTISGDLAANNGEFSGNLMAIGGDFSVAAGQAGGTAEAGYLGYAGYLDVGGAGQTFWINDALGNVSSMFPGGTSVAIYNTDDWSLAPVYFSVIESEYYSGTGTKVTWIPVPTPAPSSWYYPAGTVLAKVGAPTPAGASVLINAAVASPAILSMTGSIKISGDVAQRLYIVGADGEIKDESKLIFDGSELAIDGNLAAVDGHFTGNVQVDGDLRVKGSMTYIDTQNMRVQDAFIYLATGSAGTTDSGIVLHGGAGANMDLVIGQDGGAGEVIFGKANRAPDGDGAMDGIELVPAWMSEIKLGGVEGSLSGSFAIEGNNMKLEAANDLSLAANGESVGLMSAADYTLFDSNFSATSIVGALNELYAAGAGGAAKGNLALSDVTVDVLDFSAIGTLNSADHKFIDVYLNGVLLAPGIDVTAVAVDNVTLAAGVVSELAVDDVFTVVLRGAAAS